MSAEVTDADRAANVIARWMSHPYEPEQWQFDNAAGIVRGLAANGLSFADQRAAADDGLRARVEAIVEELDKDPGVRSTAWAFSAWLSAALDPPTATPCTARHDVHEDGVTASWGCVIAAAHEEHRDSQGRRFTS